MRGGSWGGWEGVSRAIEGQFGGAGRLVGSWRAVMGLLGGHLGAWGAAIRSGGCCVQGRILSLCGRPRPFFPPRAPRGAPSPTSPCSRSASPPPRGSGDAVGMALSPPCHLPFVSPGAAAGA